MWKRLVVLFIVLLGALAPGGMAEASSIGLTHGPMLGAMTPDSATVWLRTSAAASVVVEYRVPGAAAWSTAGPIATAASGDFTASITVTDLTVDTIYEYRLLVDGLVAGSWSFATPPALGDQGPFTFVLFADAFGNAPAPGFSAAMALNPDVALILGDIDHRNPTTLSASRTMHQVLRGAGSRFGLDYERTVIANQVPVIKTWDDHDYCTNNSAQGCPSRLTALQAFNEYHVFCADNGFPQGIWERCRWGNVDIFKLDTRSNRNTSWTSARSILGAAQRSWLQDRLLQSAADSTVRWRLILTSVPYNGTVFKDRDTWTGFTEDRAWLADLIQSSPVKNVILLSGDCHEGGIDDGTRGNGIPELMTTLVNQGFMNTCGGTWTSGPWIGKGFGVVELSDTQATLTVRTESGAVQLQHVVQAAPDGPVEKSDQSITFGSTAPTAATVGGPKYTPSATASSGLAVTLTIDAVASSVCSLSGGVVSFIAPGTCVIDANQAGNATWNPAPQVQQSFAVRRNQTISFAALPNRTLAQGPFTVSATASSGLPVAFSSATPAVCTSGGSNGATVTLLATGTCTIRANQAGDALYNPAPSVSRSFTVSKASQTISFAALPGRTLAQSPFTVTATASSGLAVVFTVTTPAVCSVSGDTVTLLARGTCTIRASQSGNGTYAAAPQVIRSFVVS